MHKEYYSGRFTDENIPVQVKGSSSIIWEPTKNSFIYTSWEAFKVKSAREWVMRLFNVRISHNFRIKKDCVSYTSYVESNRRSMKPLYSVKSDVLLHNSNHYPRSDSKLEKFREKRMFDWMILNWLWMRIVWASLCFEVVHKCYMKCYVKEGIWENIMHLWNECAFKGGAKCIAPARKH